MARAHPRTDSFRATVSSVISMVLVIALGVVLTHTTSLNLADPLTSLTVTYVTVWPLYTALYVGWSARVYGRLDEDELRWLAVKEERDRRTWLRKLLGEGTTNTSITAASIAVLVTILIAVRPEFRGEVVYVALGLLTVTASWVLMVFSFAQAYLRLALTRDGTDHLRFHIDGPPEFSDFATLAVLVSTMAATTSAQVRTRKAWRLVRTNVLIAFVFNSVIVAMMVSLIFGGLLQ
ncbi:DUF1345 domain-containing protein [Kocuria coralli]|uniref:DUF1345 domain-containing protein n=1 Tax=Kocuria coralli TaxID=1461025 RepID=A0A5J5KXY3_9MICC|nr:DUF1345 domain-containing protein [Kocuria coralli]KAA9394533.1 DUF1345 domain-containing protein [Kocuria coralli]